MQVSVLPRIPIFGWRGPSCLSAKNAVRYFFLFFCDCRPTVSCLIYTSDMPGVKVEYEGGLKSSEAEKFIWARHIFCWWLFYQWDPSTATPIEEVREVQRGLCLKILMRVSWSAYELFSWPSLLVNNEYGQQWFPAFKSHRELICYFVTDTHSFSLLRRGPPEWVEINIIKRWKIIPVKLIKIK